ncbi:hypothetical protein N7492_005850 [Penicillium capsulatum]|uniref:Uncharacterized protein n=1 Tax=Penicillium capsulatum TaxID=69766 RepID=A0A9W9IE45_9EURO|nr:hypothetical protein N7492_005850 [Penicillium capsulatum]
MSHSWLQRRGSQIAKWIDDQSEPDCPILPSTLTYEQIKRDSNLVEEDVRPPRDISHMPETIRQGRKYKFISASYGHSTWSGTIGANVIIIETITRDELITTQPRTSDLSLALYTKDHPIESLRYVFVTTIMNQQTRTYLEQVHEIDPDLPKFRSCEYGTREYEEILGTRIGRTVGYIILGGFKRGSHRIARILTWTVGRSFDLRFDIEPGSSSK